MDSSRTKLIIAKLKAINTFANQHMRAINSAPHRVDEEAIKEHAAQYEAIVDEVKDVDSSLVAGFELQLTSYYPFHPLMKVFKYLDQLKNKTSTFPAVLEAAQQLVTPSDVDAVAIALKTLNRAGESIRYLQTGHGERKPLAREITGEKDFQDFIHSFLKLCFDDIRPEDYVPSYAGSNSAVDFILKAEQIVVEVKGPRSSLNDRKAGDELVVDIARYKSHADCKTLIFCILNKDGAIKNPTALKNDVEKLSTAEMIIKVAIIN